MTTLLRAARVRLSCAARHRASWRTIACTCGDLHTRPCCYRRPDRPARNAARRAYHDAQAAQPSTLPHLIPVQPLPEPSCPTVQALRIAA